LTDDLPVCFCSTECRDRFAHSKWRLQCPPEFQRPLDFAQLANAAKAKLVLDWPRQWHEHETDDEFKGLFIIGHTGSGKTRVVQHLLKSHFLLDPSSSVTWFSQNDFHERILEHFSFGEDATDRRTGRLSEFLYEAKEAELVVFDDIAKLRLSARIATEFHSLLDYRTREWRPLMFTSTVNPRESMRRCLGKDFDARGEELVRRVQQHCTPINFDLP